MLAEVHTATLRGIESVPVRVEVSFTTGLPMVNVLGLAQSAVREGKDRVWAALAQCGFTIPARRITINLAPGDLKKEGTGFDLPLAIALLLGAGYLSPHQVGGHAFLGELGLDGALRPVRGVLAMARGCRPSGAHTLVLPRENAHEGAAADPALQVLGAGTLAEVVAHLRGEVDLPLFSINPERLLAAPPPPGSELAEIQGHALPRRALEIAAAGGHNLLLTGPPGSGKTMLARRLPGILPPLSLEEALEVTTLHSISGLMEPGDALVARRPFRAPHHSLSTAGLVGGGAPVRPGEVSLAHQGVLFLDELPEYARGALEALRQPMEDGWVSVVRARERHRFPARFSLVAAMNPCPCGYLGAREKECLCDPTLVARYQGRVSGPLRDRMDLVVPVNSVPFRELSGQGAAESSADVRARVIRARERQWERRASQGSQAASNAQLSPRELDRWARPTGAAFQLLEKAVSRLGLSSRGVHRVLRVARTLADLAGAAKVERAQVAEALQYRG